MKRKPIRVNWDDLEAAFDNPNEELAYYLDLVNGHVVLEGTMGAAGPACGPEIGAHDDGTPWFRVGDYRLDATAPVSALGPAPGDGVGDRQERLAGCSPVLPAQGVSAAGGAGAFDQPLVVPAEQCVVLFEDEHLVAVGGRVDDERVDAGCATFALVGVRRPASYRSRPNSAARPSAPCRGRAGPWSWHGPGALPVWRVGRICALTVLPVGLGPASVEIDFSGRY